MLEQAVALAKAGDKEGARKLLRQIVAQDPYNEHAWGWLAACAATVAERRHALERVVEINPDNEAARRALEKLLEKELAREIEPSREPEPGPPAAVEEPPAWPEPETYPRRFLNWATVTRRRAIVVLSLIVIFGCCCPLGAIGVLLQEAEPTPTSVPALAEELGLAILAPTPTAWFPPTDTAIPTEEPAPTATPEPTDTPAPSPTPAIAMVEAQVVEVVDGDTIKVLIDGVEYTIRYIGIDTPETKHPERGVEWMGPEASAANEELVGGQTVLLEKDVSETDQYGRLLRYVHVGDMFVNEELVRLGYAQVSTYPPDVKYVDLFTKAQREAREAGRGIWAPPTSVPIACLGSAYVADVTVPDNTRFAPGESFVKTWRVRNTGTCPWPPSTQLNVVDDDALVSPGSVHVGRLEAGETVEISVEMTAPAGEGRYRETWRLNDGSQPFGGNLTVVVRVAGAATATVPSPRGTPTPTPAEAIPTPTLTEAPAAANVVITSIFFDGLVARIESDEYAQITNQGGSAVNLAGWRLNAGDPGQDFVFPSFELQPGQSCRVYTNEVHPETCGFSFRSGQALWNNSGDCVYLRDSAGALTPPFATTRSAGPAYAPMVYC